LDIIFMMQSSSDAATSRSGARSPTKGPISMKNVWKKPAIQTSECSLEVTAYSPAEMENRSETSQQAAHAR